MANGWYKYGKAQLGRKAIDLSADDIRVLITTSAYVPNLATDKHVSDIPGASILARSGAMTGQTWPDTAIFDANDVNFAAVAGGSTITNIVVYAYNAADASATLLGLIDTVTGLPLATNGSDVLIVWASTGIMEL